MGLRLIFRLSARGPVVRDDAAVLLDLLDLLDRERLLSPGLCSVIVTGSDGRPQPESEPLTPPRLRQRVAELGPVRPRAVDIRGLRTAERFPNPFWQYTHDEEVIAAWLHVRFVAWPAGERLFELEFAEPEFLADTPAFSPYRLIAGLKTVVGTTLTPECVSAETPSATN